MLACPDFSPQEKGVNRKQVVGPIGRCSYDLRFQRLNENTGLTCLTDRLRNPDLKQEARIPLYCLGVHEMETRFF